MNPPILPLEPVPRQLQPVAESWLKSFPVLIITGPRQSGKTILARLLRPDAAYYSLEDPDVRAFAIEDPRGFLAGLGETVILDEVQRVPELLSYLQAIVDSERKMGRFILTGSSQFELIESVTQSLAGRTALLTLLPFSFTELQAVGRAPQTVKDLLWQGLYPPIYDKPVSANLWLQNYIDTYVERDIRKLLNIKDTRTFQHFVQLCAGRCGQLLNISSLAADAGINRKTAQNWLNTLQASHLLYLIQPWSNNLTKRLIKSPKLYFVDAGLAAWLIGIRESNQIMAHPLRGALFENWAIMELIKGRCNKGKKPDLYFLRDKQGHEIDALIETAPGDWQAIEMKSGATVASDHFSGLNYWREHLPSQHLNPWLVHGGTSRQNRTQGIVLPWHDLDPLLEKL